MALRKQTVIDQIEITRDGTIQVRMAKEVVDSDGSVLAREWHRTLLPPDHDIDAQMELVNTHLAALKSAAVAPSEIARLKAIAPVVWTAEVKAAYAARRNAEAAQAAQGASQGASQGAGR